MKWMSDNRLCIISNTYFDSKWVFVRGAPSNTHRVVKHIFRGFDPVVNKVVDYTNEEIEAACERIAAYEDELARTKSLYGSEMDV